MSAPPHRLARLPAFMTRWIGYRSRPSAAPNRTIVCAWSFIGAFVGMSVLFAIFGKTSYFKAKHVPPIIGSFAASAVLCFGAVQAPFSQPRALLGGHLLSAIVGVGIRKLFAMLPPDQYEDYRWVSASLSCALALVLMDVTSTTHPPAGATALLATSDDHIAAIGWLYIPVVLLSSLVVLCVALINNNVQRRYPVFWWQPAIAIPAPVEPALGGPEVRRESTDPLNKELRRSASSAGSDSLRDASEKV